MGRRPIITLNWSQIVLHSNNVFEFSTIEPLRKHANEAELQKTEQVQQNDSGRVKSCIAVLILFYGRNAVDHDGTTRYTGGISPSSRSNVVCS